MGPYKRLAGEGGWRMERPLRSLRDGYRLAINNLDIVIDLSSPHGGHCKSVPSLAGPSLQSLVPVDPLAIITISESWPSDDPSITSHSFLSNL